MPEAGSCVDCPKRTGHNKLLFADLRQDACTDPSCYHKKIEAHVAKTIAAKPKLVQVSTAYGHQPDGGPTLPRNKYTEIRPEKPKSKEEAARPEYTTCKYTADAIVTEGSEKGEIRKVCTQPDCPVHHPQKQHGAVAAKCKVEQEKRRREEALAQATGRYRGSSSGAPDETRPSLYRGASFCIPGRTPVGDCCPTARYQESEGERVNCQAGTRLHA